MEVRRPIAAINITLSNFPLEGVTARTHHEMYFSTLSIDPSIIFDLSRQRHHELRVLFPNLCHFHVDIAWDDS
jgi:hypothetical protein